MKLKTIKNDGEHAAALARLSKIFHAPAGSEEGDEAEVLAVLIEDYEEKAHPIPLPSPISATKYAMEEQELTPQDLTPYIGTIEMVQEVLDGKRGLTLPMIRKLSPALHISTDLLIQDIPSQREEGYSRAA